MTRALNAQKLIPSLSRSVQQPPKSNFVIVVFHGSVADRHCEIVPTFDTRDPRREGRLRRAPHFSVCQRPVKMFIVIQPLLSFLSSLRDFRRCQWRVYCDRFTNDSSSKFAVLRLGVGPSLRCKSCVIPVVREDRHLFGWQGRVPGRLDCGSFDHHAKIAVLFQLFASQASGIPGS